MRRRNQGNTLEILLGNRALSHSESLFTSKFFISGKSGNILPGGRELGLSEKQINTSLFRQSTGSLFHPGKNLIYFSSFSTVYFQEETPAEEGFNVKPITESLTFVVKWVKKVRLRVLGKADGAAQRSQTALKTFKHTPPSPAGLLQLPAATLVISQGGEEEEEYSLSSQLFLEEREVGWGGGVLLPPAHINHAKFCQTPAKTAACWRGSRIWTFQEVPVKAGLCWAVGAGKVSLLAPGGGAWHRGPPLGSWPVVLGLFLVIFSLSA